MTIQNPKYIDTFLFQRLFEAIEISNPSKTAITCKNQSITYSRLNEEADGISDYLRRLGVGPGVPVGICIKRSIAMVAGILGILKSGGAYVPMDPDLPGHRLDFMCKDAGISIIITESGLVPFLTHLDVHLVPVDTPLPPSSTPPEKLNPFPGNFGRDPAYIIYTSGSTGRPKGVMISHTSLCHFIPAAKYALGISADDVYLHSSSISYAVSVRQLLVPLCSGALVVVATEDQVLEPLSLFKLIKQEKVTVMDVVPSYWRTCVNILVKQKKKIRTMLLDNKLRLIISVGEPLSADLPRNWKRKLGHPADVINIFGQTETTGLVAYHKVTRQDLAKGGIIPIGRPLANTRLLVLDSQGEALQSGELVVDNPSLASGYLNLPELTAEKFLATEDTEGTEVIFNQKFLRGVQPLGEGSLRRPFGPSREPLNCDSQLSSSSQSISSFIIHHSSFHGIPPGRRRLYKTGDQVRRLPDGTLEYLGRSDRLVKINGIRIELGEIEAVLNWCPHIREAAVVVHSREACQEQICAFVVPDDKSGISGKQLRKYLQGKLPQPMIPSSFYFMESIPKTFSGKIDRLSLLANISNRFHPAVKPGDDIEKKLCQLWQEHLCLSEVGVSDNFFQLGGTSLQAISLLDSLNQAFKKNLPVNVLFQTPTIRQLAALVRGKDNNIQADNIVPLNEFNGKFPVFCVHGVGGNVIFYRDLVNPIDLEVSFWGIHVPEVEDGFKQFSSLEEMAAFHISQLRKLKPKGPYPLVGYSSGGIVAFEMACQLRQQGFDVPLLVLIETHLPDNSLCQSKGWSPALFVRFLKNIPIWVIDFILGPGKKQRIKRRILRMKGKTSYLWFDMKSERKRELLREQVKLVRGYHPKRYPGGITLLRAKVQTLLEPRPLDYGWGKYVSGKIEIRKIPGNHRSVLQVPHVKKTAATLACCIEAILSSRFSAADAVLETGSDTVGGNIKCRHHQEAENS